MKTDTLLGNLPDLPEEQMLSKRGRGSYEYQYVGMDRELNELVFIGTRGATPDYDRFYNDMAALFPQSSGGSSAGAGYDFNFWGTTGSSSGNTTSDAYYAQRGVDAYTNALNTGHVHTVGVGEDGKLGVIASGAGFTTNIAQLPFELGNALKVDMNLAKSLGKGLGGLGVAAGAVSWYVGITDGQFTASDVTSSLALLLGVGALIFATPWLGGAAIVVGVVDFGVTMIESRPGGY